MTVPSGDALRIAGQVHQQLTLLHQQKISEQLNDLSPLQSAIDRFHSLKRRALLCHCRGWSSAGKRLRRQIESALQNLRYDLENAARRFTQPLPTAPSPRQILGELDQIQAEFGQWQYGRADHELIVQTEPITLQGIDLGPFEIRLDLRRLAETGGRGVFCMVALEPNPPASAENVTHPHVSDQRLCEGEAAQPIRHALASGRLADFFLLVRGVLTTYNPDSPYVSLDQWEGEPCADCGYVMDREESYFCQPCEREYCCECIGSCHDCGTSRCLTCLERCPSCKQAFCSDCLARCPECEDSFCQSCLDEACQLCPGCLEQKEIDDESQTTSAKTPCPSSHAA